MRDSFGSAGSNPLETAPEGEGIPIVVLSDQGPTGVIKLEKWIGEGSFDTGLGQRWPDSAQNDRLVGLPADDEATDHDIVFICKNADAG